jgi:hypothetical protein
MNGRKWAKIVTLSFDRVEGLGPNPPKTDRCPTLVRGSTAMCYFLRLFPCLRKKFRHNTERSVMLKRCKKVTKPTNPNSKGFKIHKLNAQSKYLNFTLNDRQACNLIGRTTEPALNI